MTCLSYNYILFIKSWPKGVVLFLYNDKQIDKATFKTSLNVTRIINDTSVQGFSTYFSPNSEKNHVAAKYNIYSNRPMAIILKFGRSEKIGDGGSDVLATHAATHKLEALLPQLYLSPTF